MNPLNGVTEESPILLRLLRHATPFFQRIQRPENIRRNRPSLVLTLLNVLLKLWLDRLGCALLGASGFQSEQHANADTERLGDLGESVQGNIGLLVILKLRQE